jgi:hypothetical protein
VLDPSLARPSIAYSLTGSSIDLCHIRHHNVRVRAAQRKAEAQVRELVKHVCGIALSNSGCQPALVPAIMAISLYGGFFTDEKERAALIDVLLRTELQYAWPTKRSHQILVEEWDQDSSS